MNTMTTSTNSVDRLGALLAQMEILSAQAEKIKDELKEAATATTDARPTTANG